MNRKSFLTALTVTLVMMFLLMTALSGCGRQKHEPEKSEPLVTPIPVSTAESDIPAGSDASEVAIKRTDGERFEDVIVLEGMEETVRYEHIRNDTVGIEMDYDYESFVRQSGPDRECFISVYDNAEDPENYLEVTYSPEDADTVAASVSDILSKNYDINMETYKLDNAGSCIRIDASADIGGKTMPEKLQMVYIIPAADGSRIAAAHYSIEGAEGFGRRFSYIVKTLVVIGRKTE